MRLVESGRLLFPASAAAARRYAEQNLLSIHGRRARLAALVGSATIEGEERDESDLTFLQHARAWIGSGDWLLLRDYSGTGRERRIFFVFRGADPQPSLVVKVRQIEASGVSLHREAEVLRLLAAALPPSLAVTIPRVEDYGNHDGSEVLAISALPGAPLTILMQRTLRPRVAHARHLEAAGEWLGSFHLATRDGPSTVVHGDFWARNLLFTRPDAVQGVIDWEHAAMSGLPWPDLFILPTLFITDAPAWRSFDHNRALARAFAGRGAGAAAIRSYFSAYARAATLSLPTIRTAFEAWNATRKDRIRLPTGAGNTGAFSGERG